MLLRRRPGHIGMALAALTTLSLVSAGCGSNGGGPSGSSIGTTPQGTTGGATASGITVNVTEQEFAILPASATAPAGPVTFKVTNTGPDEVHEFVVLSTELAPDALPTKQDGSADEEGAGVTPVDEIEDIAVGDSPALTVSLDPGNYVFICNIVDADTGESHYHEGMRVGFTVQ